MNILADELSRWYEEIQHMDFYREIFPDGELDEIDRVIWGDNFCLNPIDTPLKIR